MRISSIIRLLEKAKREHGDIHMDIRDYRGDEIKVKGVDTSLTIRGKALIKKARFTDTREP